MKFYSKLYKRLVFLALCFVPYLVILGQTHQECSTKLTVQNFVSDGQDHQIIIKNNKYTRLHVVFYPNFQYRIVVCCNNKYTPVEFNLIDNSGKSLFSNVNKDYIRTWDFQFSSAMNAIIELKLSKEYAKEENAHILIGYKNIHGSN